MSTRTSSNDAAPTASTQVTIGEVLSDFDAEELEPEPEPEPEPDNDAASTASTQASLGETVDDFDAGEPDERTEPEIDPSVDPTLKVGVGEGKDHYHVMWIIGDDEIVSACPNHDLEIVPLREAATEECEPCEVCEPVDWRLDDTATEGR